jgi:coniferyl-aldehyde dehydrogenase
MPPDTTDKRVFSMQQAFNRQHAAFQLNPVPSADQRKAHLRRLASALKANRHRLAEAIDLDFKGRSRDETLLAEIYPSLEGIRYAANHVSRWMRPDRRQVGLIFQPARARVLYQPLGVVGVISPWNYPVFLTIGPLTAALAAGNRVMIKASEYTPTTTKTIREMLADIFPDDHVSVVTGDADVAAAFSRLDFDHLLFTGATLSVARSCAPLPRN